MSGADLERVGVPLTQRLGCDERIQQGRLATRERVVEAQPDLLCGEDLAEVDLEPPVL